MLLHVCNSLQSITHTERSEIFACLCLPIINEVSKLENVVNAINLITKRQSSVF